MSQLALKYNTPEVNQHKAGLGFIKNFSNRGKITECFYKNGVQYFVNEYWTSRQRQANKIHEISYRACFKPQLPEFFINHLTQEGDVIYDPFMGRGTTPIQAALMSRKVFGNDINPLSIYLTRPRLHPPAVQEVVSRLDEIDLSYNGHIDEDMLVFFHLDTLNDIYALRRWLMNRDKMGELDYIDDWIRMVSINRLTGHSSGFFSVYTMPPNQAVSLESQRRINQKRNQTPQYREIKKIIIKKTKILLKNYQAPVGHNMFLSSELAYQADSVPDSSIDLIVTSPPFLDVVQYASDNWMRCWFVGIDVNKISISIYKNLEEWKWFIRKCFIDFARVVKVGGNIAFETGEVRGGKILLDEHVIDVVKGLPFKLLGVVVNEQNFTKTANCWGVSNNKKGTNSNRIVLLKRVNG